MKAKNILMLFFFCLCFFMSGTVSYAGSDMEVMATKQIGSKVKITWKTVEDSIQYDVLVSEDNKKDFRIAKSKRVDEIDCADDTVCQFLSVVLPNITKSKTYYFEVRALDAKGGLLEKNTTYIYNGNIVSTSKQKYSYKDMQTDIRQLEKKYAEYVHVEVIGKTADNRNIYDVILGNPNAKKCVVFQSSIHAREYMTTQLVMEQMEYYLDNYNQKYKNISYIDIFNKVCVHVIPMVNPDGVTISQSGFEGIRKSSLRKKLKNMHGARYTTVWKANARGIDLNNQFDYKFKYKKKYSKGAYAGYGGKKPVTEKETKALVELVNKVKPSAVVNYHAMGNVIFCNYGGSGKVQKKVYKLAGEIRGITGYTYMGLDQSPGFANWLVCKKNIPSCTVEIGKYSTPVPISQFKTVWKQNKDVMVATARLYY